MPLLVVLVKIPDPEDHSLAGEILYILKAAHHNHIRRNLRRDPKVSDRIFFQNLPAQHSRLFVKGTLDPSCTFRKSF